MSYPDRPRDIDPAYIDAFEQALIREAKARTWVHRSRLVVSVYNVACVALLLFGIPAPPIPDPSLAMSAFRRVKAWFMGDDEYDFEFV